ncbi:heavy-metal-associated domain protein [Brucella vulpis]|uniref:heavy-metal-associated domain-containing protein n=1 Tax=Brucella vulpis TaxID=981386 RepID=UPI00073AD04C|nr:heavy-metal-associated domain protein [Brucella vulpis]CUW50532.1 heavy-metal-associated domain protein [Brucella vulpis]
MMKFSIPKMKCGGCAEAVTAALRKLDAEAPVVVDLANKEVAYGGTVAPEAVLSALAAAGYPAASAQ